MGTTEGVNHIRRRRKYGARDKEKLIELIIKLHDEGYSQVDIADMLSINRGTIKRWNDELHFINSRLPGEAGKLKSKKYNYDENYFATICTPNQAYIVGYITGDGTIFDRNSSKRLVLALAETDKQLLFDISEEMNMREVVKFRKKNAENEQNKFSLTINSTKMCDDLIALGIGPRKTGSESWIDFGNHELQWAYLRGFFDADGHIRVYQRNGYQKARMGFTGNPIMLKSILNFLKAQGFAKKVNSISHKQGCSDLYLSSIEELRNIGQQLYSHGDIILFRKYEKFLSLMI
ncbi:helix-turn-helix domain-containing protein [Bacillus sp. REN16]|uniref:helix-turn-helix domain-containing protein n=1 Tax=Bacillus sp. REN16 TaxID=2887296 RepID=UPI001E4DE8AB|nr:LAGLIDADG family homing endonuclease [Bacillus sp. REN16]MCC3358683.1 helix-turn-helix domain-containing protein [Bacillus sp. REN16]